MAEESIQENNNSKENSEEASSLPRWVQFVYDELEKHKKRKKVSDGAESAEV